MNIKLELDLNSVNVILASLGKQPYETVSSVIDQIRAQAQEQMKPQPVEAAA